MVEDLFALIGTGEVTGVFQLESQGMRRMLVEMQPKTFEHIIAAISLYRPGPLQFIPLFNKRLHGEEPVEYLHPKLEPILAETYGIIAYQEQLMRVGSDLFGYSLGEADLMRRAVSKKKLKDLIKHKEVFIAKGPENGVPADVAEKIFDQVEYFAAYGFNKCLTGATEIIDAVTGRLVRIGDLAAGTAHIEQTITCNTEQLKLQAGQVEAVHENGVKPVYRLKTQLGRQIEATGNHPFYTFDGWKMLDDLAVGGQIAVPRRLPVEGKNEWPDYKVIVLGHLLAEGDLCHPNGMYYYTSDAEQWRDYVAALEQFENVAASTHRRRNNMHDVYSRKVDASKPNGVVVWIEQLGLRYTTSYTKFIPDEVFSLTNRQISLLIARMWEGDGNITEKGRFVYYATSSERMGRQLQHLLLRLGIISRLRSVTFKYQGGEKIGFQLHIVGNENLKQFANAISVHFISAARRESIERMILTTLQSSGTKDVVPLAVRDVVRQRKAVNGLTWDAVAEGAGVSITEFEHPGHIDKGGFTTTTIGRLAEFFDCDELRRYADNDIYWDRITAIEYIGEQMTYDLTIPGTHNFIANDILVHNSHAADYAVITCQTAFLKCHYAPEYYTALLTVQRDKIEDVTLFTADCRRLGIPILPPNINYSELDFTIEELDGKRGIRFGLGAIKGVGDKVSEMVIAERTAGGPYLSLSDFSSRLDLGALGGKRPLEALTKVGVFDAFGERHLILAALERMTGMSKAQHNARKTGQVLMFDAITDESQSDAELLKGLPNVQTVTQREKLDWEKELIGLYVSSHPLDPYMALVKELPNLTFSSQMKEEAETIHDRPVTLIGMTSAIRRVVTKKNDTMAIVTVDDLFGSFDAVFFPRTWAKFVDMIKENEPYIFRGKADTKRGSPQVLIDSITQEFGLSTSADDDPYYYDANPPRYNNQRASAETTSNPPPSYEAYETAQSIGQQSAAASGQSHNGNGNGNGHGNGTNSNGTNGLGNGHAAPVSTPATVWDDDEDDEDKPPPARQLLVAFAPFNNGKRESWQRRIERIYRELTQLPGDDELTFRIPDPDTGVPQLMTFDIGIDYDLALEYLERMKDTDKAEISWTDLKN
jgi:DNA polymerase-3 subunit alpha